MASKMIRALGRAFNSAGLSLQGRDAYVEKLVPSARVLAVKGKELQHDLEGFVAPTASVIGDVTMGNTGSVWYSAVVRGDKNPVTIGRGSAIGDRATVDGSKGPVTIGADVTIGANARLESCTISDGVMVGPGAKVLKGSFVASDCFIDAGAVVPENTRVSGGELWTGNPATKLRTLTPDEIAYMRETAATTAECGEEHFQEAAKTVSDMNEDLANKELREGRFMRWDEPLPTPNATLLEYDKLAHNPHDVGMFRAVDYDSEGELEEEERLNAERDAEMDAAGNEEAMWIRVSEAAEEIFRARPDQQAEILDILRNRDPEAAAELEVLLAEVEGATKTDDAARALDAKLRKLDPTMSLELPPKEEAGADEAKA